VLESTDVWIRTQPSIPINDAPRKLPTVRSAVEKRIQQVSQQLDDARLQLARKTRGRYANEGAYIYHRRRSQELIAELEDELSMLTCPSEYDELAVATAADELGVTFEQVRLFIKAGEIEVTGKPAHERISRAEMERIAALGTAELQRQWEQESAEIFAEAVPHLQAGNLELAERASRRLNARRDWRDVYASVFLLGLKLTKGEIEDAQSGIRSIQEYEDPIKRTLALTHLRQLLTGVQFTDGSAQTICDHLLASVSGTAPLVRQRNKPSPKQPTEQEDELQRRATYLVTAMQLELRKHNRPKSKLLSELRDEKFNLLLHSVIYTALYAEATCQESEESMKYFARTNSMTSIKNRRIVLLENLHHVKGEN
jgi:hypothetical protein